MAVYIYDRHKALQGQYKTIQDASKATGLTANEIVTLMQSHKTKNNLIFSPKELTKK
jgi:hypothetical protein